MSRGDMRCLYSGGGFISNVWILMKRVGGDRRWNIFPTVWSSIWDTSEQLIKFPSSTARGVTSYFETILNCHKCICRIFTPNTQKKQYFKIHNIKSPLSFIGNSIFVMHLKIMRAKTENNGFTHVCLNKKKGSICWWKIREGNLVGFQIVVTQICFWGSIHMIDTSS